MRYNPVYKCRMCGEKYTDKSTSGDGKCIIPVLAGIEITGKVRTYSFNILASQAQRRFVWDRGSAGV